MTTKETVRALLDRLPDNCSIDDVPHHLHVVQAVSRGDGEVAAGARCHTPRLKENCGGSVCSAPHVIWAESAYAALDGVITYIAQDSREHGIKV